MKKKLLSIFSLVIAICVSLSHADDHASLEAAGSQAPFNLQANLCVLNPGKTMVQYDRLVSDYWEWSVANDVEVTFVRHVPVYSHADAENPRSYDFIDFLAADYSTMGRSWDKWLGTADGQKLNEKWGQLANCNVKQGTVYFQWGDVAALSEDDDRVVTWNWCTRKEGVSPDQLMAKHQSFAAGLGDKEPAIGWYIFVPRIGAANLPGQFAHVSVYPDFEALMTGQQHLTEGGWRDRHDYYTSYADCRGESAMVETIMRRPSN